MDNQCHGQSITGLSKYLMNECGFKYVLLGHTHSDTIEGRFCHFRQLSGANYFISMRQLYESDRKLRTLSLLMYSQIFPKEIQDAAKAREERLPFKKSFSEQNLFMLTCLSMYAN